MDSEKVQRWSGGAQFQPQSGNSQAGRWDRDAFIEVMLLDAFVEVVLLDAFVEDVLLDAFVEDVLLDAFIEDVLLAARQFRGTVFSLFLPSLGTSISSGGLRNKTESFAPGCSG